MSNSKRSALLEKLKTDVTARLTSTTSRLPSREREAFEALVNGKALAGKQRTQTIGPRKLTAADLRGQPVDFKYEEKTAGYKFIGKAKCVLDGHVEGCHHQICIQAKGDGISYLEYDTVMHYKGRIIAAKTPRMKEALRKQRDVQLLRDQEVSAEWREKTVKKLGLGKLGPGDTNLDAAPILQEVTSPDNAIEQVGRALSHLRLRSLSDTKQEFANIVQARITAGHGSRAGTRAYHWRNPAKFVEFFASVQITHIDAAVMNVRDILELNAALSYEVEYCLRGLIGQCRELITHFELDRGPVPGYTLAQALHDVKELFQYKNTGRDGASVDGGANHDVEDTDGSESSEAADANSEVVPKNDIYFILVNCASVEGRYSKEMMRAAGKSVLDGVAPDEKLKQIKEAGLVDSPLPSISAIRFNSDCEHAKKLSAVHWILDMAERKKTIAQLQQAVIEKVLSITGNNPDEYLNIWEDVSGVEEQLSKLENEKPYSAEHGVVRNALDKAKVVLESLTAEHDKVSEEREDHHKILNTDQIWDLYSLGETILSPNLESDFLFLQSPEKHGLRFAHPEYTVLDFLHERRLEGWCFAGAIVRLVIIAPRVCSRNPLRAKSIFKQVSILVNEGVLRGRTLPTEWTEPLRDVGEAILHTYGYLTMECTHIYGRSDVEQIVYTLLWPLVFDALIAPSRFDATRNFMDAETIVGHNLRTMETNARTWFLKMSDMFAQIIEKDEFRCATPDVCTAPEHTGGDVIRQLARSSVDQGDVVKRYLESHSITTLEEPSVAKVPFSTHDDILLQVLEEQALSPLEASRMLRYLAHRVKADTRGIEAASGNKDPSGISRFSLDILWLAFLRAEAVLGRTPDASNFASTSTVLTKEHWKGRSVASTASSKCINMQNHCNISELCDPASRGKAVGFFEGYRLGFRNRKDIGSLLEPLDLYGWQHGPETRVARWNELIQMLASCAYRCSPEMAKVFRRINNCIREQVRDEQDVTRQCGAFPVPPDDDSCDTSDSEFDRSDRRSVDVRDFLLKIEPSTVSGSEEVFVSKYEATLSAAASQVRPKLKPVSVKERASRSNSPVKRVGARQSPTISNNTKQVAWHLDAEPGARGRDSITGQKVRDRSATPYPTSQHDTLEDHPASSPATSADVAFTLSGALQNKIASLKESLNKTKTTLAANTELHAFMEATTDGTETLACIEQQLARFEGMCDELTKRMA